MMGLLRTIVFVWRTKLVRLNIQLNLLEAIGARVELTPATLRDEDRVQGLCIGFLDTV